MTAIIPQAETNLLVDKWKFVYLREGIMMAIGEEEGCYVYMNNIWHQCLPESHNPLDYNSDWFYRG